MRAQYKTFTTHGELWGERWDIRNKGGTALFLCCHVMEIRYTAQVDLAQVSFCISSRVPSPNLKQYTFMMGWCRYRRGGSKCNAHKRKDNTCGFTYYL